MLKIGCQSGNSATGIHGRHLDADSRITYLPGDTKSQMIEYASTDV